MDLQHKRRGAGSLVNHGVYMFLCFSLAGAHNTIPRKAKNGEFSRRGIYSETAQNVAAHPKANAETWRNVVILRSHERVDRAMRRPVWGNTSLASCWVGEKVHELGLAPNTGEPKLLLVL